MILQARRVSSLVFRERNFTLLLASSPVYDSSCGIHRSRTISSPSIWARPQSAYHVHRSVPRDRKGTRQYPLRRRVCFPVTIIHCLAHYKYASPASETEPTSSEQLALDAEMDGTRQGEEKAEEKRLKDENWARYTDENPRGAGNTMNRG